MKNNYETNPKNNAKIKIAFLDIDGVLTPTPDYIPGEVPNITPGSIKALKKLARKGFKIVFITARGVSELRGRGGLEELLKKHKMFDNSMIFCSEGLDQATYDYDFKLKNNRAVFKNGNVVLEKKPIIKRETFGNIDKFLLYKMLLGKEIKQELKYKGFKIKSAMNEKLTTDARIFFQLENNTAEERARFVNAAREVADKMEETFRLTKKFGSPVELDVIDIVAGISIKPKALGKHFAVLRVLNLLKVKSSDKILGYAFGDTNSDAMMKIRKDIEFIKVKNNTDFIKQVDKIISNTN